MKKTNKLAALGLTAGLVAGGGAGLVLAVPAVSGAQSTTTVAPDSSTSSTDAGRPEPGQHIADALAPLVADGTLTQDQADKVAEALKEAMPEGRPGMGRGGPGLGRGGPGLDAAATALGITADELRTDLQDGQSIAQVAEAQGVDLQSVIDAMVAEARTKLDEKVTAGDLTQEEADTRLAEITERITDMVSSTMPAPGGMGHGRGPDADAGSGGTTGS